MHKLIRAIFCGVKISILLLALSFTLFAQGKNPVILIPGLTGSELRDKTTRDRVWFKTFKSKSEDLRLPIMADPAAMHDNLEATDVLRSIKIGIFPSIDVYGDFIKAMASRGGYHEEKWETPSDDGFEDSLYIFPYDWRLDNVGNARLLVQKVEALKLKLKKPSLKFDIVAHSMGGLISRYAAMYGDADLPAGTLKPQPTWAGRRDFDKIILMGTPNEGAVMSLNTLLNGFAIGGVRIDLPFMQDTSKFTIFTIPAAYQLLPAPGTLRAFDDKLQPIEIDLYDPKVWSKYGWNVLDDKGFASEFTPAEQKAAPVYFAAVLERAKRLHEALAATRGKSGGISFYILGADCTMATDAMVIYRDEAANKWKTLFKPKGFTRSDGVKITDDDLKAIMQTPGDGVVTLRSLDASTQAKKSGLPSVIASKSSKYICEDHNKLASNARIQDYIISVLNGKSSSSDDDDHRGNNNLQVDENKEN